MVDIDSNTIIIITGVAGSMMAILAMAYTLPSGFMDSSVKYIPGSGDDDGDIGTSFTPSTQQFGGKSKTRRRKHIVKK